MTNCMDCKNLLTYKREEKSINEIRCIYGVVNGLSGLGIIECSHFKPKPKESKELKKQKKALTTEGQTITANEQIAKVNKDKPMSYSF